MLAPSGLSGGLRAAATVAEHLQTPTLIALWEAGITFDGAVLVGYTYGGAFLLTGFAYEVGVAAGSAAGAAFQCQ